MSGSTWDKVKDAVRDYLVTGGEKFGGIEELEDRPVHNYNQVSTDYVEINSIVEESDFYKVSALHHVGETTLDSNGIDIGAPDDWSETIKYDLVISKTDFSILDCVEHAKEKPPAVISERTWDSFHIRAKEALKTYMSRTWRVDEAYVSSVVGYFSDDESIKRFRGRTTATNKQTGEEKEFYFGLNGKFNLSWILEADKMLELRDVAQTKVQERLGDRFLVDGASIEDIDAKSPRSFEGYGCFSVIIDTKTGDDQVGCRFKMSKDFSIVDIQLEDIDGLPYECDWDGLNDSSRGL